MAGLKLEIMQERPFASLEEEALLNLLRTSDCLNRAFHVNTRGWGVTSTQYNVLRILRGAQPDGLTCAAIGSRMIAAEPDITRLLKRLKALKLIRQDRDLRGWACIAARDGPGDSGASGGVAGAFEAGGTEGVNSLAGAGPQAKRGSAETGLGPGAINSAALAEKSGYWLTSFCAIDSSSDSD